MNRITKASSELVFRIATSTGGLPAPVATANAILLGRLDVVVPVWNEAAWLDRLLSRCKSSGHIANIIVADNVSSDVSRIIARHHGCIVVPGGRPARGRNSGARAATAPKILFVDADTIVPAASLDAALTAFHDDSVVAVHFRTIPLSNDLWIKSLYSLMHWWISGLDQIGISQGIGTAIAVRTTAFRRIGGFREDIAVGEDAVFLRDVAAVGRVVYLRKHAAFTSARRLHVEGGIVFPLKVVLWTFLRLCKTRASFLAYRWDGYSSSLARQEDKVISDLGL